MSFAEPDDANPRACAGCPRRRLVQPYIESLLLNVMYNGINHMRQHPTARIGWKSMWHNLRHGFEWDDNDWGVNQIGHPYQGSNYFTSGRAHGLTFWESTAVAAFGSATWEYLAENNRASLNDLINTTLGGIALGEVMHRTAWMIRDPTSSGGAWSRKEYLAMAVDPLGGLQRLTSGDIKRVAPKPEHLIPQSVAARLDVGMIWQGDSLFAPEGVTRPFVNVDMDYAGVRAGHSHVPFGAFAVAFQAGGGNPISEITVRGRLLGHPVGESKRAQFSIFQTFDYQANPAYVFGGQGFEAEIGIVRGSSAGTSLWLAATGGSTVLGAVDTLIPPPEGVILRQDVLEYRDYDYGPTIRFGGVAELRKRDALARLTYQGYQVSVVDGARAYHVLQRLRLDLRLPIAGAFSLGTAGEYFFRKTYYWSEDAFRSRTDDSTQVRVFLSWRLQ